MATLFKPWIDSPDDSSGGNVFSQSDFASDSQRTSGYASGQTISSKRLNTILREISLITTALMDQFCPNSTVTLVSSLADVKSALSNSIASVSDMLSISDTVSGHTTAINGMTTVLNQLNMSTVPALATRVTNIENGTTTVNKALKATQDADGDVISSSYASSLSINGTVLTLKSKSNATLVSATITNALNASTASYATTAGSAGSAAFLGSNDVGSGKKPIYLDNGSPMESSETVGGTKKPVYLSSGTITACSSTVGNSHTPVYMSSGTITATGFDLRKTLINSTLDFSSSSSYKNVMNFVKGSSYSMSTLGVSALYSALDTQFGSFPAGTYPIDFSYIDGTTKYFSGYLSITTGSNKSYQANVTSIDGEVNLIFRVTLNSNSTYDLVIKRVDNPLGTTPNVGSTTDMTCTSISILGASGSSTSTQTAKGKKISWTAF